MFVDRGGAVEEIRTGLANYEHPALSPDGSTLWITLAGTHQIGRIDLVRLHAVLPEELSKMAQLMEADALLLK